MKRDEIDSRPTSNVLIHLAWSFLWRAIGIAALVYFAVGLIAVGMFYVAFVWCHTPRSIGEAMTSHFETALWILFATGFAVGPVLAFRMIIGKQFGEYRLTLVKSSESKEEG